MPPVGAFLRHPGAQPQAKHSKQQTCSGPYSHAPLTRYSLFPLHGWLQDWLYREEYCMLNFLFYVCLMLGTSLLAVGLKVGES